VHTGGNRNAATLSLVFLDFYCLCVKNQICLIFCPRCTSFGNFIAGCVDASVTAIAEERATANQRAAFCFGFVLLFIVIVIISIIIAIIIY
jgi:hypothetical protein